jgi:hypothetical protein
MRLQTGVPSAGPRAQTFIDLAAFAGLACEFMYADRPDAVLEPAPHKSAPAQLAARPCLGLDGLLAAVLVADWPR